MVSYASATTDSVVTVTATYGGDSNNLGSSNTATFDVVVEIPVEVVVLTGPATSISLSGCGASPSSIPMGSVATLTAFPSCTVSAFLPSSAGDRYLTSSGADSITIPTCTTAACSQYSVNVYDQLETTYEALANAASWDAGLSITITGTSLGSTGYTICQLTPAGSTSSSSCSGYADYGTTVTFPSNASGAFVGTRWEASPGAMTAFSDTAPGNVHTVNYYKQVNEQFAYSISGGGSPTLPAFTCTQFGLASACLQLTTVSTTYWLDYGSPWSATEPLTGSSSTERWDTTMSSGSATAGLQVTISYYHQFSVAVDYSVSGGGTLPGTPTLSYPSHGQTMTATLGTSATSYWMDAGQPFTVTATLAGAQGERWGTPSSSYTVTTSATVNVVLYHQFSLGFSYSVKGGGTAFVPPAVSYTAFGLPASSTLQQATTVYWADASTPWTVTNVLQGSGTTERWATNQTVTGSAGAAYNASLAYFHQYMVTLGYNVVDGGAGYSPPATHITEFGVSISATTGWADAGGAYSFTDPLTGSTATERWYAQPTLAAGTISAAGTVQVAFYHQFAYTMSYTVLQGGSGYNNPQVTFTALGAPAAQQLLGSASVFWFDANSKWTVATQLPGSNTGERWMTNQTDAGTAVSSVNLTFQYYHQYQGMLSYSIVAGGSPKPPNLNYTQFGTTDLAPLTTQPAPFWIDANSRWTLPDILAGSTTHERWIANGSLFATVEGVFTKNLPYLHQYFVKIGLDSIAGGTFNNATNWYNLGASIGLSANATGGWKFSYWKGAGAGSYNGTTAEQAFTVTAPENETAIFNPGLTVTTGSYGSVTYHYGSVTTTVPSSSQAVFYPPLGANVTLTAQANSVQIIFTGWAGALNGNYFQRGVLMASPSLVSAGFGLDYPDIQVFSVASIGLSLAAVYIFVVHRRNLPIPVK